MISPDSRTVYVATAGFEDQNLAGNLTVISARTDQVRRVLNGFSPDDLALGQGGQTLYVAEQGAVVPVRTATLRPGRPIRLAGFPLQLIIGPGSQALYVLNDSGRLSRISVPADRVTWTARTAPLPSAMGLTPDGRSLYVLGVKRTRQRGYVVPVSTSAGAAGRRIAWVATRLAIAFGPGDRTAYVLCSPSTTHRRPLRVGIGSVFPVTLTTGRIGKPVQTGRGSMSMAIVPGGPISQWERAGSPPADQRQADSRRNSARLTWAIRGLRHTPQPGLSR